MLKIQQAKPNPLGKDRLRRDTPSQQLAGEWVDIKNTNSLQASLNNLYVYHKAYKSNDWEWELVIDLSNQLTALPAGRIVRIHSGGKIGLTQLRDEDIIGADYHVFTGKNYVWRPH